LPIFSRVEAVGAALKQRPQLPSFAALSVKGCGGVHRYFLDDNQWLFLREFDAHGGKDRGNDCTVDYERVRENQETLLHQLQENDQQAAADSINADLAFHW
jgi:hypothetical protein